MQRALIAAVWLALLTPGLALAQDWQHDQQRKGGEGGAGHPPEGRPREGPRPGELGRGPPPRADAFAHGDHFYPRVHGPAFAYPHGYGYYRWGIGMRLPPVFLVPPYFYAGWAPLGLQPPPPGCQWVRYGPDLLLVNVYTGQVIDVAYGVFW